MPMRSTASRALTQLGLSSWLPTIVQWLGHYDGLETMLEDQYDPAICVRQVMLRHVVQQASSNAACESHDAMGLKQRIVADLVMLDFVAFCAYWGEPSAPRAVWLPLNQPWLSFRYGREGDDQLCAWYTENAQDYVNQLSAFLLSDGCSGEDDGA